MWQNPQETADLVTFTREVLNGKLHFLFCVYPKLLKKFINETDHPIKAEFHKKVKHASTSSQVLNCDGVMLEI